MAFEINTLKEGPKMENVAVKNRLSLLRAKMAEYGIDYYMMPTSDFHNS